uniref:THAP domain-containing protein 1 n=1 Tax=Seriola lalandi dorsalis TaxID=1841481 RepID=A0A3B4XFZ9_SERLL
MLRLCTYSVAFGASYLLISDGRTYLSFHLFPKDTQLQRKWVKAIRGHQGACFKVCSWHFIPEDYDEQHSSSHLKRGSCPKIFSIRNWYIVN